MWFWFVTFYDGTATLTGGPGQGGGGISQTPSGLDWTGGIFREIIIA